ncbi:MAG: hypothetical protein M3R57_09820, partial [Chloroflexota bacterium]|nr:hypothetical protein [Chloroflexota bacterium]
AAGQAVARAAGDAEGADGTPAAAVAPTNGAADEAKPKRTTKKTATVKAEKAPTEKAEKPAAKAKAATKAPAKATSKATAVASAEADGGVKAKRATKASATAGTSKAVPKDAADNGTDGSAAKPKRTVTTKAKAATGGKVKS